MKLPNFDRSRVDANALVIALVPGDDDISLDKDRITRPSPRSRRHCVKPCSHAAGVWNWQHTLENGRGRWAPSWSDARDGTRHSHGHRHRSQELRGYAGIFARASTARSVGPSTSGSPGKLGCAKPSRADDKALSLSSPLCWRRRPSGPPPPSIFSSSVERTCASAGAQVGDDQASAAIFGGDDAVRDR